MIGLWLLVLMLISMFLFTRKVERRCTGIDRDFVAGVSAQWLAIMAASLVATYLELVPMDQLFWLMIAIVATMAPEFEAGPAVHGAADELAGRGRGFDESRRSRRSRRRGDHLAVERDHSSTCSSHVAYPSSDGRRRRRAAAPRRR